MSPVRGLAHEPVDRQTARGRAYSMPENLDELTGPWDGMLSLPAGTYWGPGINLFDIGDDASRRRAYRTVLQEGTLANIRSVVSKERLVADWPMLLLPVCLAKKWENRFSQLKGNETATW